MHVPPFLQKLSVQRGTFIGRRVGGYAPVVVVGGLVMKTGARCVGSTESTKHRASVFS